MNVLVDTNVWSLALRRRRDGLSPSERALALELADLIRDDRIVMVGPVRQELLSGVRSQAHFDRLRERLADFDDEPLDTSDFEEAAQCHNRCMAGGIAGSPIDFLLCAISLRRGLPIFTSDADFELYARPLSLTLHRVSSGEASTETNPP
jgi:predicted nucleic acid-binding protein